VICLLAQVEQAQIVQTLCKLEARLLLLIKQCLFSSQLLRMERVKLDHVVIAAAVR